MTTTLESPVITQTTKNPHFNVAIVGSGIIGLHCALEVLRAGGKPAIFEAASNVGYPFQWERSGLDEVESDYPINALRVKAIGGTTLHWGGTVPRLEYSEHIDWLEEKYYAAAQTYLGVFTHLPGWFEREYFIPAIDSLNWDWKHWENTTNPSKCKAYSTCSPHCPSGARYSPVRTINDLKQYGVNIVSNTAVINLGAVARDHDLTIVAAGTVESTRLALLNGIEAELGFAHGVVLTSATAHVKTGGFRIGYPTIKAARPKWDIFVDPTAGMKAPEWIARGFKPGGFGYEYVLASQTEWGAPSISVRLSSKVDSRNDFIPKIEVFADEYKKNIHEAAEEHRQLVRQISNADSRIWHDGISFDHLAGTLRNTWDQGDILFLGNAALPTIGKANPTLTALAFAIQELRKRL